MCRYDVNMTSPPSNTNPDPSPQGKVDGELAALRSAAAWEHAAIAEVNRLLISTKAAGATWDQIIDALGPDQDGHLRSPSQARWRLRTSLPVSERPAYVQIRRARAEGIPVVEPPKPGPRDLTVSAAAKVLGLARETVSAYVRQGRVETVEIAGRRYVRANADGTITVAGRAAPRTGELTIPDAAGAMGVTTHAVRRWIRLGRVEHTVRDGVTYVKANRDGKVDVTRPAR